MNTVALRNTSPGATRARTRGRRRLLEWIHPSQLPACYGGALDCPLNALVEAADAQLGDD